MLLDGSGGQTFDDVLLQNETNDDQRRDRRRGQGRDRPPAGALRAGLTGQQERERWRVAPVRTTAKKYSFQEKTRDRMNAATNPGAAIGTTMRRNACQIDAPSTSAACSSSTGIELNWSRMIQITIGRFMIV